MNDRKMHRLEPAFALCAALVLAAGMLSGCQEQKYERIELESSNSIVIGQKDIGAGDSGIVIGQEEALTHDGTETAQGESAGGSGDGAAESDGNQAAIPESVTLLFGGDVFLSNHVLNAYQSAGGIHGVVDEGYRNIIQDADFFMVNEEFPFSSRGVRAEDKQYTFRLEPERVSLFQEMGIDAVTLANNHALDFGVDALLDTCATLDGAGILHTGAGANLSEARKPVELELEGQRIAIIGATRVVPESGWVAGKNHPGMLSSYDTTALLEEVRSQKQNGNFVIVYVHWGVEKDERPQDYQRTLGQQYIDAGADLVIGAHPHVLQGIEYYKGKPIVYSLGNFVFGSSIPRTMLLEVTLPAAASEERSGAAGNGSGAAGEPSGIGSESAPKLRLIPGTSGAGYTRMLTDSGKIQEFRQYMESISSGITVQEDGTVAFP